MNGPALNEDVAAADMARERGVDPKTFRAELRRRAFAWHAHDDRWSVVRGSDEHRALKAVLDGIAPLRG